MPQPITSVSRLLAFAGLFVTALAAASPANALVISPTFDSSITTNANAAQIEASINSAINTIDGLYSNVVTVPVTFTYDPAAPTDLLSTSSFFNGVTYAGYKSLLQADAAAHPLNTVLATAIAHLSSGNDANGASNLAVGSALVAMLTGGTALSATININSNQPFGFTQPVSPSQDDLTGGLEHELDEVLGAGGAGSTLNSMGTTCNPSSPDFDPSNTFFCNKVGPLDLYRYSAPGTPSFSTSPSATAYLSINGGTTSLVAFNQDLDGDMADFAPNCGTGGGIGQLIQNAFNCPGPDERYTVNSPEFIMLESIGWDPVPEPFSLACILPAAVAMIRLRRRFRKAATS
jgi:hypothetical protein